MSIYIDLLKSFSRVHKRDIRLLEQGPTSPSPEAQQLANQAVAQGSQSTSPTPVKGNESVKVWTAQGGATQGRVVYQVGSRNRGAVDDSWDEFVSLFEIGDKQGDEAGVGGTTDMNQAELRSLPPEQQFEIRQQQLLESTDLTQETKDAVVNSFREIYNRKDAIYKAMSKEPIAKNVGSASQYARYLFGTTSWSFQKSLLAPKFTLNFENGIWTSQEQPLQEAQTSLISDSFKDLLNFIADSSEKGVTEKDCEKSKQILSGFYKTNRGDVVVKPKGDASQGLSFDGGEGRGAFLREVIDKAASICGHAIETLTVRAPITGTGNSNNIRGTGAEDILEIASLAILARSDQFGGKLPDELATMRTMKLSTLYEKLKKAKIDSEGWVRATQESGIDPETVSLAKDLYEAFQVDDQGKTLIQSILEHSLETLKVRKPVYAVPVGDQVGGGKRQDIFEVFNSNDEAVAAANRSGLSVTPVEMSIEDAFGPRKQEELEALKRAGIFKDGQVVSVIKVSLKNYLELDSAKYGSGSANTFAGANGLMRKSYASEPLLATISSNLQMSRTDQQNMRNYFNQIDEIAKSVFDVPKNVIVTTSDGKKLNARSNAQQTFAKSIIDKLSGLGYTDNPKLKDIMDNCKKIISKIGTKYELDAAIDSLKNQTVTWLQSSQISKDLLSSDPITKKNAQMFLAHKMFHSGGSDDNNLICDYRDLTAKKNYIFRQNDPLRDAWRSVMGGQADSRGNTWDLLMDPVTGESRITTGKGSNRLEIKLKNNFSLNKSGDTGRVKSHHTNFILEVNRAVMEAYHKQTIAENINQELGTLLKNMGILLEKMRISNF